MHLWENCGTCSFSKLKTRYGQNLLNLNSMYKVPKSNALDYPHTIYDVMLN